MLVKEFRTPIMVTLLYIGLSIAFHVWSLHVRWYDPMSYWWTDGLLALFVLQRFSKLLVHKQPFHKTCQMYKYIVYLKLVLHAKSKTIPHYVIGFVERVEPVGHLPTRFFLRKKTEETSVT